MCEPSHAGQFEHKGQGTDVGRSSKSCAGAEPGWLRIHSTATRGSHCPTPPHDAQNVEA